MEKARGVVFFFFCRPACRQAGLPVTTLRSLGEAGEDKRHSHVFCRDKEKRKTPPPSLISLFKAIHQPT